jgi:hypothetical protein
LTLCTIGWATLSIPRAWKRESPSRPSCKFAVRAKIGPCGHR